MYKKLILGFILVLALISAIFFSLNNDRIKHDIGLGYEEISTPKLFGFVRENTLIRFSFYSIDKTNDLNANAFLSAYEQAITTSGFKKVNASYLIQNFGEQFYIYVFSKPDGIDCRVFRQCGEKPLIEIDMSGYSLDAELLAFIVKEKCNDSEY